MKKKLTKGYTSNTQEAKYDAQGGITIVPKLIHSLNQPRAEVRPALKGLFRGRGVHILPKGLGEMGLKNHLGGYADVHPRLNRIKTMITLYRVTGLTALIFLSIVSYYLFYPYYPVRFHTLPIPVLNENHEVEQGENLVLRMDFVKTQHCENVKASFYLVDGFVIKMNTESITRPQGQNGFIREILMPTSAPVGDNRHIQIEYSCKPNPLRTVYYTWKTEEFSIKESLEK